MGQQVIAGRVREERIADKAMLRVDVSDRADEPGTGFTRYYSPSALYAISPAAAQDVQRWVDYQRPSKTPQSVYLPEESAVAQLMAGDLGGEELEF